MTDLLLASRGHHHPECGVFGRMISPEGQAVGAMQIESGPYIPAVFGIVPSGCHVWSVNLAQDASCEERLQSCLALEELRQAARLHFAHDRRRFVIRRAVRRQLLARYLAIAPKMVRLIQADHRKPYVAGQGHQGGLRFSCSHSGDQALIAVAHGRELGIDLEFHQTSHNLDDLISNVFSPAEISEFEKVHPEMKTKAFFDGWTRKEAFVKAIGSGLAFPLNRFTVSLSPDKPATLLRVEDDPSAAARWQMRSLNVRPDYSAALVYEGTTLEIQHVEWKPRSDCEKNPR